LDYWLVIEKQKIFNLFFQKSILDIFVSAYLGDSFRRAAISVDSGVHDVPLSIRT